MPFEALVERIRAERKHQHEVPGFDTKNGNEEGRFLFLLEAPGPGAVRSRRVSFDNEDAAAKNLKIQLGKADIERNEIAIWNVVPWYLGNENGTVIRAANAEDVRQGCVYLDDILCAMGHLKYVVLVGGAARRAHVYLSSRTVARIVSCHHTSARVSSANPSAFAENIKVFKYLKRTAT